jgi:hypothetical protein
LTFLNEYYVVYPDKLPKTQIKWKRFLIYKRILLTNQMLQ